MSARNGCQYSLSASKMEDGLRWQCLWWVYLAAVAGVSAAEVKGSEQCKVLNQEFPFYPLPNNLTVKPLSDWWFLEFIVSVNQTTPIVCIQLEEKKTVTRFSIYSGKCENGTIMVYNFLSSPLLLQTWNTFDLGVTNDTVFVQAPQGENIELMGENSTLQQDSLQMRVKKTRDVEVAVGCAVSCPEYYYDSPKNDTKTNVIEWKEESLYFYFRPGSSFSKLYYKTTCTRRQNITFLHELIIKLEEKDAEKDWHLVELTRQRYATVHLNDILLTFTKLPKPCNASMHAIRIDGDGFFSFSCQPSGVKQTTKERERQMDATQYYLTSIGISSISLITAVLCVIFVCYYRSRL